MNILIAILVLGIIIFVHELGHFLTAKFFKMPVSEFAIGMGPQVYSYNTMKTTYSLRAIPIGGFVNIEGMELDSEVEDGFNSKPAYARFVVLGAGVFMNFLLAFIILFVSIYSTGKYIPNEEAVIGSVFKEAKSIQYIRPKDKVLELEGYKIVKWTEIGDVLKKLGDKDSVSLKVERAGKIKELSVPLTFDLESKKKVLGVLPEYTIHKFGILEASKLSLQTGVRIVGETLSDFIRIVRGEVKSEELSGPIGIIRVVGEASKNGLGIVIHLMALLSVNVGVLNLLPFPALDGGRIVFVLLEMIGIKVNKKVEERLHMLGMLVLFGFIIFITTNDVFNLAR